MKIASSEHVENMLCTQIVLFLTFRTIYVRNMFSTCSQHVLSLQFSCTDKLQLSLVDARISASDKDLPVALCFSYVVVHSRGFFLAGLGMHCSAQTAHEQS